MKTDSEAKIMKKFTMAEIESYLSQVRRAGACKGNMDMAEAAYASGDIEELRRENLTKRWIK